MEPVRTVPINPSSQISERRTQSVATVLDSHVLTREDSQVSHAPQPACLPPHGLPGVGISNLLGRAPRCRLHDLDHTALRHVVVFA